MPLPCSEHPDLFLQKRNRIDEAASGGLHNQIDRVEIDLAIEASGQIGFGICAGMKSAAKGAAKPDKICAESGLKA
jgi:hypothetical protein